MVSTTFLLMISMPAWALLIGVLDWVVFAPHVDCPRCKGKLKVKWWWFVIPTTLELLMLLAGYALGKGAL